MSIHVTPGFFKWTAQHSTARVRVTYFLSSSLTDPVVASQALLKPLAADLGRYVSVVPLSTMMPLPRSYTDASASMLTPFKVMSNTCHQNQDKTRIYAVGTKCWYAMRGLLKLFPTWDNPVVGKSYLRKATLALRNPNLRKRVYSAIDSSCFCQQHLNLLNL